MKQLVVLLAGSRSSDLNGKKKGIAKRDGKFATDATL